MEARQRKVKEEGGSVKVEVRVGTGMQRKREVESRSRYGKGPFHRRCRALPPELP